MDSIKAVIESIIAIALPLTLQVLSPLLSFVGVVLGVVYLYYKVKNEKLMWKKNCKEDGDKSL